MLNSLWSAATRGLMARSSAYRPQPTARKRWTQSRTLSADNVYLHLPTAGQEEKAGEDHIRIAYSGGCFVALPSDPAADHPDAIVVRDYAALCDELRSGLEAHLGWVIERLSAAVGCKERGLWLYVTDRIAGTLAWLMQERDKEAGLNCINRTANPLIRVIGSPLSNKKVGFFELTYNDQTHVYLDRATCCYWYKQDEGDYCSTCPTGLKRTATLGCSTIWRKNMKRSTL